MTPTQTRQTLTAAAIGMLAVTAGCLGLGPGTATDAATDTAATETAATATATETATPTETPGAAALADREGEPPYPSSLDDVSVAHHVGLCNGPCPSFTVEVCGNGTVFYVGYAHVHATGLHSWTIPDENVSAILNETYRADVFALNDTYAPGVGDARRRETTVRIAGRSKHVGYNRASQADAIGGLFALESVIEDRTGVDRYVEGGDRDLSSERADDLYGNSFCS